MRMSHFLLDSRAEMLERAVVTLPLFMFFRYQIMRHRIMNGRALQSATYKPSFADEATNERQPSVTFSPGGFPS